MHASAREACMGVRISFYVSVMFGDVFVANDLAVCRSRIHHHCGRERVVALFCQIFHGGRAGIVFEIYVG